jgi:elongation factor Ts
MSTITTEQVKELRDATGVSVMQCRKALEEANGDMEAAKIILQKKGGEAAQKKADRTASDGRIFIKNDGARAVILTLFCETDFVAQNQDFIDAGTKLVDIAWQSGADAARAAAEEVINAVVLKIGENIQLGDISEVSGGTVGVYTHFNGKSAAVVALDGGNGDVAKDIAMHAAAMKPSYLAESDISEENKAAVRAVMEKEVADSDKPEDIKAKMLEGKMAGFFKEQTLLDQPFFKNPEKTIAQFAKEAGATVTSFAVYTVGA